MSFRRHKLQIWVNSSLTCTLFCTGGVDQYGYYQSLSKLRLFSLVRLIKAIQILYVSLFMFNSLSLVLS